MKSIILFVSLGSLFILAPRFTSAQSLGLPTAVNGAQGPQPAPDSRAWTDPALNHNRLLIGEGNYQLIGNYKVKGSQFLFGQKHQGDMFSPTEKGFNIYLSYNTYNQEVEFYSTANPDKSLTKVPGELDSFIIHADPSMDILQPLKFVYGSLLGTKDKSYYQEVCKGSRFSIYKRYKSDLGYDPGNYGQSELRQFDLEYEYYYTDTENKGVKKIKPNAGSVIKEFKSAKDLSGLIDDASFTANPEAAFCKALSLINGAAKGF